MVSLLIRIFRPVNGRVFASNAAPIFCVSINQHEILFLSDLMLPIGQAQVQIKNQWISGSISKFDSYYRFQMESTRYPSSLNYLTEKRSYFDARCSA